VNGYFNPGKTRKPPRIIREFYPEKKEKKDNRKRASCRKKKAMTGQPGEGEEGKTDVL